MTINECIICWDNNCDHRCNICKSNICCSFCYNKLLKTTCPKCRGDHFKTQNKIKEGDFSFNKCCLSMNALSKTYQAITATSKWNNLENYIVDPTNGYMFSNEEFLNEILIETDRLNVGHSGASWGWVIREMDFIAKNGWELYTEEYINLIRS